MTKIAILGVGSKVGESLLVNNKTALEACGSNTGNLLFQHAIRIFLQKRGATLIYPDLLPDDISSGLMQECDLIVVPCADFLNPEYSLEGLWNRLRYCNKPCLPIGLGIGSDHPGVSLLSSETSSVMDYFLNNSTKVCVRGKSTVSALRSLGFKDKQLVATGCFSNFLGKEKQLSESYETKLLQLKNEDSPHIAISGDRPWKEATQALERILYQIFRKNTNAIYLIQSHAPLIDLVRPGNSNVSFYEMLGYAVDLIEALNPHGTIKDLAIDLENRYRVWFDAEEWLKFTSNLLLSIGMRLHGNMVAMQAGVPSLWIAHDPRTTELIETMSLPYITQSELEDSSDIYAAAAARFNATVESYFLKRRELMIMAENAFADCLR